MDEDDDDEDPPVLVESSVEEEDEAEIPSVEELKSMKKEWEVSRKPRKKRGKIKLNADSCSNEMCGCVDEECVEERWICGVEESNQ
eukprot:4633358-Karenia_brevis.AAC.1